MQTITGQLLGQTERLVQVQSFLVGERIKLDPPASRIDMLSEWSFQILIGAPIARLPIVITIGTESRGVVDGFRHEQQTLAAGCGVRARAAEAPIASDSAANSDSH